jgi:hypothetical protein
MHNMAHENALCFIWDSKLRKQQYTNILTYDPDLNTLSL